VGAKDLTFTKPKGYDNVNIDKLIDGKAQQAPGDYITRGLLFHYHEIITQNRKSNEKKSELLKEGLRDSLLSFFMLCLSIIVISFVCG